jgi:regulatory protein
VRLRSERFERVSERLEHALGIACRYLDRRERTVGELRRHLDARGIDAATAEAAVAVLLEQGLIDDARFARLFAQDRRELELWGSERIRRRLLALGIEPELVDAALAEAEQPHGGGGELDRALTLLRRRFPAPLRARRDRDRALGVLLRRGYTSEHAFAALAAHAREHGEDRRR